MQSPGKLAHLPARHSMHLPSYALKHSRIVECHVAEFFEHHSERRSHRLLHHRVNAQSCCHLLLNRIPNCCSPGVSPSSDDLRGDPMEDGFGQVRPCCRGQLHHFTDCRFAASAGDLFAHVRHHQFD